MAEEADVSKNGDDADSQKASQGAAIGWWWVVVVFPLMTALALRLMGSSWLGSGSAAAVSAMIALLLGWAWARAQARGARPMMQAARFGVRLKWWLHTDHERPTRRGVLAALIALVALTGAAWVFMPSERLGASIGMALCLTGLCLYAGHKCCGPASTRRKLLVGAAAFISGVQGNYLASLTVGSGTDAKAIELALTQGLDSITPQLRGVQATADRIETKIDRNEKKIDDVVELTVETRRDIAEYSKRLADMDRRVHVLERKNCQLPEQHIARVAERRVQAEVAEGSSEREAVQKLREGDPKDLVAFIDKEISRIDQRERSDKSDKIELHRERAAVCVVVGKMDEARSSLDYVLSQSPDDLCAANDRAYLYQISGDLEIAAKIYDRIGQSATTDSIRSISLGNLGTIEHARGNLDAAEAYHVESLSRHLTLGDLDNASANFSNLGAVSLARGDFARATEEHRASLAIEKLLNNCDGIARQVRMLGSVKEAEGDALQAIKYYAESLEIANGTDGFAEALEASIALGYANARLGNYKDADLHYKNALQLLPNDKMPRTLASIINGRGINEMNQNHLNEAKKLFEEALELYLGHEFFGAAARTYCNLGAVQSRLGDYQSAETSLSLAIKHSADTEVLANSYNNLALIMQAQNKLSAAEGYFWMAVPIYEASGMRDGAAMSYANLGTLWRLRENSNESCCWWTKARDTYRQLGMRDRQAEMDKLLDSHGCTRPGLLIIRLE